MLRLIAKSLAIVGIVALGGCSATPSTANATEAAKSDNADGEAFIASIFADGAGVRLGLAEALAQNISQDADLNRLENKRPTIRQDLFHFVYPRLVSRVKKKLPRFQKQVGNYIDGNLDDETLQQVVAFLKSPAGMNGMVLARARQQSCVEAVLQSGDVTPASLTAQAAECGKGVSASLTPEDRASAVKFVNSPAGNTWLAFQPKLLSFLREASAALNADESELIKGDVAEFLRSEGLSPTR